MYYEYIPLVCGLNFDSIRVSFVKQDNVNEVQFVNIFNLATPILHPFSSFKVNKNKFQDFLRSLIYSHMNQQK